MASRWFEPLLVRYRLLIGHRLGHSGADEKRDDHKRRDEFDVRDIREGRADCTGEGAAHVLLCGDNRLVPATSTHGSGEEATKEFIDVIANSGYEYAQKASKDLKSRRESDKDFQRGILTSAACHASIQDVTDI